MCPSKPEDSVRSAVWMSSPVTATTGTVAVLGMRRSAARNQYPSCCAMTMSHTTTSGRTRATHRSEEHTSELQSPYDLVCRLLLEKKKQYKMDEYTIKGKGRPD